MISQPYAILQGMVYYGLEDSNYQVNTNNLIFKPSQTISTTGKIPGFFDNPYDTGFNFNFGKTSNSKPTKKTKTRRGN